MQCQVPLFSGSSTNAAMMQICKDPMCNSMPFLSLRFVMQPTRQIIEAFCNTLQGFFADRLTFESISTIVASAKPLNALCYLADSFDISLGIRLQCTLLILADFVAMQTLHWWKPPIWCCVSVASEGYSEASVCSTLPRIWSSTEKWSKSYFQKNLHPVISLTIWWWSVFRINLKIFGTLKTLCSTTTPEMPQKFPINFQKPSTN